MNSVIQLGGETLFPLPPRKRLHSTLPIPCLHPTSQNSHKFNCQAEVCKKRGFAHSVGSFLYSSMLLALLPLISCFCFLFLSAISYHPIPKYLLGTFLHGSPPTGLPISFLPLQGEAAQEAKVWLQRERNHMCSWTGEQSSSSALLQACVLFTCIERKGR